MLQAELERREPELAATLNRRAASWCEANGQPELAIEYAAAAGDTDELARLVSACAFPYYRGGRVTTVERWLTMFDDAGAARAVSRDRGVRGLAPRVARSARRRRALGACSRDLPSEEHHARREPVRGLGGHGPRPALQKGRRADAARRRARGVTPAGGESVAPGLRPPARSGDSALGRTRPSGGQPGAGCGGGAAEGAVWAGVVARSELALLALERGDLSAAESELVLASAFVDDVTSADYVVTAMLLAVTARLAVAKGQGARARKTLVERPAHASR